jgi:DNA-binding IclR family transcriptional regulator
LRVITEDITTVESGSQDGAGRGSMLQTLQRAVAVMALVARHAPMSVQQISDELGLERTVIHRIVRTLESEMLLERQGNRVRLGPRHLQFANSYVGQQGLRQACLPYQVEFLYRTFANEPWALALMIRVGATATLVSHLVSPTAPLQSLLAVGSVIRVEETAAGRSMLAYEPEEEVVRILGAERARDLRQRLSTIRENGGIDFVRPSERVNGPPDLSALAVCIRRRSGNPVGALTLSGAQLDQYLSAESTPAMHLRSIAQQVGQAIE